MQFRFFLNDTEINEPTGFDDFKPQIERTDHHGISAGVSLNKLGFFGNAVPIIRGAYDTDVDTELSFTARVRRDGESPWTEIYRGVLDLATCESETGDICRINCNAGEVGIKTKFNNRYDTSVYISSETTLDGDTIGEISRKNIGFPAKLYVESATLKHESETEGLAARVSAGWWSSDTARVLIPFGMSASGAFTGLSQVTAVDQGVIKLVEFQGDYKDVNMDFSLNFDYRIQDVQPATNTVRLTATVEALTNGERTVIPVLSQEIWNNDSNTDWRSAQISGTLTGRSFSKGDTIRAYFSCYVKMNANNDGVDFHIRIPMNPNNHFSISGVSEVPSSNHDVFLVKDVFSHIAKLTGGRTDPGDADSLFTVKSDWLKLPDVNAGGSGWVPDTIGGGALKALLNGYELRKADLTGGLRPPVQISFKYLFEAVNAIDNIGWGFSEEDGKLCLRVERWQWFYRNEVLMTINNPSGKKRAIRADKIYNRLKIGYEKFHEDKEMQSIDGFHTEREYSRKVNAADGLLEKKSKFIADPFALEVTRRKQFEDEQTDSFQYDDNVFVVCLKMSRISSSIGFFIDTGINDSAGTIMSPDTMYNARISPERNAIRWAERFFEANSPKDTLEFTAGKGNVIARGSVPGNTSTNLYLEDSAQNGTVAENQSVPKKPPLLKPEILSFEYPFTFDDYAAVMRNPYGKIIVDGEECFIQKIQPSLFKGTASFELIPKAGNG